MYTYIYIYIHICNIFIAGPQVSLAAAGAHQGDDEDEHRLGGVRYV